VGGPAVTARKQDSPSGPDLCRRRIKAGTAVYRALPPPEPDPGGLLVAVIVGRALTGRTFSAAWVTRTGRARWRLAVWVPAPGGQRRLPRASWGIRRALSAAAQHHHAASLAPPSAWYGTTD
jgi:hypothetical protein